MKNEGNYSNIDIFLKSRDEEEVIMGCMMLNL